ncbi:MAG: hypothetical protein HC809_08575 [Gammaproteobacteria bacterium]|nr:hypothetical protein [Gammaproteobacteria bacterium]
MFFNPGNPAVDICEGNEDRFEGTNQKVAFCDITLGGSLKKVLMRKSGVGGSGNGVGPVCSAGNPGVPQINFMVVDTLTTDGNPATCTETAPGSKQWACAGFVNELLTPEMGISDVAPNETFGGTASSGCGTNVFPSFETVFGVPVTLALRDALQSAQGLVPGQDDLANMPSLSSAQYVSIFTGKVKRWSEFFLNGASLTTQVPTPPGDTRVTVCRRVDSSGTFAASTIRQLKRTCVAGALAPAASNPGPPSNNGPVIVENSGSGDVEACLTSFNNTGNFASRCATNGCTWAIGQNSTDRIPSGANNAWRFVKLDGVEPTFENVANGSYTFSVTSTVQWKSLAGDKLTLANRIATDAAQPSELGAIRKIHPWGESGLMALAENGFNVSYVAGDYDTTLPVTPWTHRTTVLSNCLEPTLAPGRTAPVETTD